ncbi:MAG: hypothetical protein GDA39_00085 [Hyphomonadaceae bacterium]|nr:hypothetical protein [Hyphomonadaceae bacterium]MBC6411429.1 hypothetical protein [Hyphomonadaceae bacterium]
MDERLKRVSDLGDPLEVVSGVIDFEVFRPVLDRALKRPDRRRVAIRYDRCAHTFFAAVLIATIVTYWI